MMRAWGCGDCGKGGGVMRQPLEDGAVTIARAAQSVSFPSRFVTPTLLYGKGIGQFDVQGTIGATLPTGNVKTIGRTFPWNNGLQYHVLKKWPDVEVNYTHFQDGAFRG